MRQLRPSQSKIERASRPGGFELQRFHIHFRRRTQRESQAREKFEGSPLRGASTRKSLFNGLSTLLRAALTAGKTGVPGGKL